MIKKGSQAALLPYLKSRGLGKGEREWHFQSIEIGSHEKRAISTPPLNIKHNISRARAFMTLINEKCSFSPSKALVQQDFQRGLLHIKS